jgi:hypothetical protein
MKSSPTNTQLSKPGNDQHSGVARNDISVSSKYISSPRLKPTLLNSVNNKLQKGL